MGREKLRREAGLNAGERLSAAAASLVSALAPVVRLVRPRLGREIAVRAAAAGELAAWGRGRGAGPCLWLHGASAGELLGAVPLIAALRGRRDFALLVTHFSPSGEAVLERLEPEAASVLPLDRPGALDEAMKAVAPGLLVFAKLDVWPGLAAAAERAGVPAVLVNGVVRSGSRRLEAPVRSLFRATYASLDRVCAAGPADADRLLRLGARPEALITTGDASFDLALERADRAREPGGWTERFETALPARPSGGARLVAGSTWPPDETALLDAIGSGPAGWDRFAWQIVLAPHRPDEAHVRRLLGVCRRRGEPVARFSDREGTAALPPHGIVVFDRVGRLAELYTAGDAAYVGGGLGGTGLHNVLEPAAAGVPVLFGRDHDREDAAGLERAGGGLGVDAGGLAPALGELGSAVGRGERGRAAREYVASESGAAAKTAEVLLHVWGLAR